MSSRGLNTNQIGLVSGFGNSDPKDSNHMRFQIGSVWIWMEGSFYVFLSHWACPKKSSTPIGERGLGDDLGAIPSFFGFRSLEAENIFRWGWVFDEMMTRWWFQICVMFTCSWGTWSNLTSAYFSDGLQPQITNQPKHPRKWKKKWKIGALRALMCWFSLVFRGGEKKFTRFLLTLVVSKGSIDPLQPTRGKAPNKEVILLMVQKSQTNHLGWCWNSVNNADIYHINWSSPDFLTINSSFLPIFVCFGVPWNLINQPVQLRFTPEIFLDVSNQAVLQELHWALFAFATLLDSGKGTKISGLELLDGWPTWNPFGVGCVVLGWFVLIDATYILKPTFFEKSLYSRKVFVFNLMSNHL